MKYFVAVLLLVMPLSAHGATCPAGQYLKNGVCSDCGQGVYYCPGDDTRHDCPSPDGTNMQQLITECGYHDVPEIPLSINSFGFPESIPKPSTLFNCHAAHYREDISCREGQFTIEENYNVETGNYWFGCHESIDFYSANPGYYLSGYRWTSQRDWYGSIKPCTNEHPAHSHYSGAGTPDDPVAGGNTDYNDCPWECDDGYGLHEGQCVPLCTAGATEFHVGEYVFNIYKEKYSTPAINIGFDNGTVCYVPLVEGSGKGALNVDYKGVIYHTSD